MLEAKTQPFYNVDSYKHFTSKVAQKIYKLCQKDIEIGWQKSEQRFMKCKYKPTDVGERVYVKNARRKGEPRKSQPIYNGPYRVVE